MTAREPDVIVWRKSSFSAGNGACVEVGWRTSTFSAGSGNCVEVAVSPDRFLVRDSKNPAGPLLALPAPRWRAFVRALPEK